MRGARWLSLVGLLWMTTAARGGEVIQPAAELPKTTPWDLKALSEAPPLQWVDETSAVRSLTYSGEAYRGKPTQVFALYASPGTLAGKPELDRNLPGVVLVHGGGGTAFPEWVTLWARRGYAAIAMDLAGKHVGEAGGPGQDDTQKFGTIAEEKSAHWSYHAVANVIRAHSLLRTLPGVDAERTALTGISWGGYLTCLVASLDTRFKAAVPVYGCGYLHENSVWTAGQLNPMTPENRAKWVSLYDPSSYLPACRTPLLMVNGTNDFAYPLDSYQKCYDLVPGEKNIRVTVNMPHGHPQGWAPVEIARFIDARLKGEPALLKLTRPEVKDGQASAVVSPGLAIKSAALHWTGTEGPINKRTWQTAAVEPRDHQLEAKLPAGAAVWFFTVADEKDGVVSSEIRFTSP